MSSRNSRRKSASLSSLDSGLDGSTIKKSRKRNSRKNNLKEEETSFNKSKRSLSESDFEDDISFFGKKLQNIEIRKTESPAESSDDDTIENKNNSVTTKHPSLKSAQKKKSKIHIIDNQVIHSEAEYKDGFETDTRSVISVRRPLPSYSVSSESDSESNNQSAETVKKSSKYIKKPFRNDPTESSTDTSNWKDGEKGINQTKDSSLDIDSCESQSGSKVYSDERTKSGKQNTTNDLNAKVGAIRHNVSINDLEGMKSSSSEDSSDEQIKRRKQVINSSETKIQNPNYVSSSDSEENEINQDFTINIQKPEILSSAEDILKMFLESHSDYKKKELPTMFDLSSISEEDEVYLLQIPKTVNPQLMKDVSFSLSKKTKIRTEAGKYTIRPLEEIPTSLLIYANELKSINPKGILRMEKYVKVREPKPILVEYKNRQELPDSIRVRHPLFGPDYEAKIQLDNQIKEKLLEALQRFQVKERKRKTIIKEEIKQENDPSIQIAKMLEEQFSNSYNSCKRQNLGTSSIDSWKIKADIENFAEDNPKIRRKHTKDESSFELVKPEIKLDIEDLHELNPQKRRKKYSEDREQSSKVEEFAIQENTELIKNEYEEVTTPFEDKKDILQEDSENSFKRKKKHHRQSKSFAVSDVKEEFEGEVGSNEEMPCKRRKKHAKNETLFSEVGELKTEFDIHETKLIKNEFEEFTTSSEDKNDILQDDNESNFKKKKKSHRQNNSDVSDIKKESDAEIEALNSCIAPKKKRKQNLI